MTTSFYSTYPVYLKLWQWVILKKYNFTECFPSLKPWESSSFKNIFTSDTDQAFGTQIISLVQQV